MVRLLINFLGLAATWLFWLWLVISSRSPAQNLLITIGGSLIVIPLVFAGRLLLDHQPDPRRAAWITIAFHCLIAIPLGSAVIAGVSRDRLPPAGLPRCPSGQGRR